MRELSEQDKAQLYIQELESTIAEIYLNREYIGNLDRGRFKELLEHLINLENRLNWGFIGINTVGLINKNDWEIRLTVDDLRELKVFISKWYSKKAEPETDSHKQPESQNDELDGKRMLELIEISELHQSDLDEILEKMRDEQKLGSKRNAFNLLQDEMGQYGIKLKNKNFDLHKQTVSRTKYSAQKKSNS